LVHGYKIQKHTCEVQLKKETPQIPPQPKSALSSLSPTRPGRSQYTFNQILQKKKSAKLPASITLLPQQNYKPTKPGKHHPKTR
jgi:hypothetical protein